jgi:hypothetical protein
MTSLTKMLYFHRVFTTACNNIGCCHWHFPLQLVPPPPQPTWILCFMSVCYGIYCLRENVFCHQWVEEVFTPVHLFMNLNIINPVSYNTPVKMSLGTKMLIYFLAFCTFHFLLYSLLSFLHQFNLQLFLSLIAWEFVTCYLILHHVLVSLYLPYLPKCSMTVNLLAPEFDI